MISPIYIYVCVCVFLDEPVLQTCFVSSIGSQTGGLSHRQATGPTHYVPLPSFYSPQEIPLPKVLPATGGLSLGIYIGG